jgi:signal transduction histidine kinase/CheY-like chemotaxis protein
MSTVNQLPRSAVVYLIAVCSAGASVLWWTLFRQPLLPDGYVTLAQAALFIALATIADLKQLRLQSANYSVATATNFACALILGPQTATWVSAIGAAGGDIALGKPLHKVAFNASAVGLSVAAGSWAMYALRTHPETPLPSDVPAFIAYAVTHTVINQGLVCAVITLATRTPISKVISANYRGVVFPIVTLYPLGLLMAVVYGVFGGWIGLVLLVAPVIAAYAALERARQLQRANEELTVSSGRNAQLYDELRAAHEDLGKAHSQLQQTQQQIIEQERLRALGQMASGVAHGFNNALAPVIGFSELLLLQKERWRDDAHLRRQLELIHTAALDASSVVRQLREFYRKSDDQNQLVPLDLTTLVQQVVEITQPRWRDQAQAAGVTIQVNTDLSPVPPVAGDEASLREAITNLIFNAVDAMPNGGTISMRTRSDGRHVLMEVRDSGTGMTPEVRQRCLDPFFTTKGSGGTGMGLAIVQGVSLRHRGRLDVESIPGEGTTICITLPVCERQAPFDGKSNGVTLTATVPVAQHQLRVLVVDDEPSVRDVISAYLTSFGYLSDTASNGTEGLHLFQGGQYDVVVTDRAMPDMNGDHLARAIKDLDAGMPVIMLTGFGDMLNARGEKPTSVDLVLSKPVLHADLHHALRRLTAARD